jgi:DinB superfamily
MNSATLHALASFPEQLEAFYGAIPEAYRRWEPASWDGMPSENFTPIGQLCHVRDIEIDGYHQRFQRPLREDNPVLPSIDGYLLAKERDYANADAGEAFAAFRAARAQTVQVISGLGPAQLSRTARFEGFGPVTVRSLVHILCSHDQQHLAGLQWLLGKIEALRAEE